MALLRRVVRVKHGDLERGSSAGEAAARRGSRWPLLLPPSGSGISVPILDGISELESQVVEQTVDELGEVV